MDIFIAQLAKDLLFYQGFADDFVKKSKCWQQPSTQIIVLPNEIKENRDETLDAFCQSISLLHDFLQALSYVYEFKTLDFPHIICHYDCKKIEMFAQEFKRKDHNGAESLVRLIGPLQSIVQHHQNKFTKVSNEFFDMVSLIKATKDAGRSLNALFDERIAFFINQENSYGKPISMSDAQRLKTQILPRLSRKLNELQASLTKSYPLWKIICPQMPALEIIFPPKAQVDTGYPVSDFCYNYLVNPLLTQMNNKWDSLQEYLVLAEQNLMHSEFGENYVIPILHKFKDSSEPFAKEEQVEQSNKARLNV